MVKTSETSEASGTSFSPFIQKIIGKLETKTEGGSVMFNSGEDFCVKMKYCSRTCILLTTIVQWARIL